MPNGTTGNMVLLIKLKPGLIRFEDSLEEIGDVLVSLYRIFGPSDPTAGYVGIPQTDPLDGSLWLAIVELIPPDEEEGLEEPLTEDDLEELLEEEGGGS